MDDQKATQFTVQAEGLPGRAQCGDLDADLLVRAGENSIQWPTEQQIQRASSMVGSTLHKVPDPEERADRPGSRFHDFWTHRRRVSQIALEYLVAMWTRVGVEIIAQLNAALRTFYTKHNSAKAREVPLPAQGLQRTGV